MSNAINSLTAPNSELKSEISSSSLNKTCENAFSNSGSSVVNPNTSSYTSRSINALSVLDLLTLLRLTTSSRWLNVYVLFSSVNTCRSNEVLLHGECLGRKNFL